MSDVSYAQRKYSSLVYAQLYRLVMYYVHLIYRSLIYAQLSILVMYCIQIIGLSVSDVLCTDHWFMHSCIGQ